MGTTRLSGVILLFSTDCDLNPFGFMHCVSQNERNEETKSQDGFLRTVSFLISAPRSMQGALNFQG
jgi:hypothetical protein